MQTFLSSLSQYLIADDVAKIQEDLQVKRLASFRINTLIATDDEVLSELAGIGIVPNRFPLLPHAYTLTRDEEYTLKGNALFNSGKLYLQSLSSQVPALLLDLCGTSQVLDACAAPGSKTSQMMAIMNGEGSIDALDPSPIRYAKLKKTLDMLSVPNTQTYQCTLQRFLTLHQSLRYDRILLDVPCSGEGRLSDKDAPSLSLSEHQVYADRGFELLSLAAERLAPSGRIVFSTCTLHPSENEAVVSRFLDASPEFRMVTIDLLDGIDTMSLDRCSLTQDAARLYSDDVVAQSLRIRPSNQMEGFYVAVLERIAA